MSPFALDTNALIYAVEGPTSGDPKLKDFGRRVNHRLALAREQEVPVFVPAVVLAEYLAGVHPATVRKVTQAIGQDFIVVDFGGPAAQELAEILRNKAALNAAKNCSCERAQFVKVDAVVAATAIAAGVTEIVTQDRDYNTLTNGKLKRVKVSEIQLPTGNLFEDCTDDGHKPN